MKRNYRAGWAGLGLKSNEGEWVKGRTTTSYRARQSMGMEGEAVPNDGRRRLPSCMKDRTHGSGGQVIPTT
ncbi:hypothetical protein VTJ04DRAFT_10135 [Mycothermus thermophilus]|uniref:uncharacterized protein n=1 Tax=Humicola insolens TaxID=85995 RepID=UPI003742A206